MSPVRLYRRSPRPLVRTLGPLTVAVAVAIAAGCGGGGGEETTATDAGHVRTVRGAGFVFSAPDDWTVTRTRTVVTARPDAASSEFVSVSIFPLLKPFRPSLWPAVVKELDGVADRLAKGLAGTVEERRTLTLTGGRARSYQIVYKTEDAAYVQRLTFLLRGRTEWQLLCRFRGAGPAAEACGLLTRTFRLSG